MSAIGEVFQEHNPGYELEYDFVSNYKYPALESSEGIKLIFKIFSAVAIFIAIMGLIGLSQFNNTRRTKEVGIHKAMGAHTGFGGESAAFRIYETGGPLQPGGPSPGLPGSLETLPVFQLLHQTEDHGICDCICPFSAVFFAYCNLPGLENCPRQSRRQSQVRVIH